MAERKKLEFISSVTIMNTPMKKQKFIVDEMIYPGLHILSGDPKIGKSWMMMDMCLSIAKGEKFLGHRTEQGHVVYMALEDTFVSLQSRMYELTGELNDNLQYLLLSNSIGNGLEEDLQECKKLFPDLKLVVIDTLQKVRETVDMKYGTDYKELSVLKSLADQLEIAIILVHHNRKTHDSNPNNMISGTNGIAGCADGLLVFTRNGNQAKLNISGRGAPSLELNLSREKAKWKLLDDVPDYKPDLFPFAVHDFMCEKKNVKGTASEICKMLNEKFPEQDFNNNWLYRDLLQHDDEIRSLGIDYGKDRRKIKLPESEHRLIENTHEPLIDTNTWEIVQRLRQSKRRKTTLGDKSIFAGITFCADCKHKLYFHRHASEKPENWKLVCSLYRKNSREQCTMHGIKESHLKEIVLSEIRNVTEFARERTDEFAEFISQKSNSSVKKELANADKKLKRCEKRLTEVGAIFRKLYEDHVLETINDEQFRTLSQGYTEEQNKLKAEISELNNSISELKSQAANTSKFTSLAKKYTDITELTQEILHTFVSRIEVHEKQKGDNGSISQEVDIYFTHIGTVK